jgi:hypothetical protein
VRLSLLLKRRRGTPLVVRLVNLFWASFSFSPLNGTTKRWCAGGLLLLPGGGSGLSFYVVVVMMVLVVELLATIAALVGLHMVMGLRMVVLGMLVQSAVMRGTTVGRIKLLRLIMVGMRRFMVLATIATMFTIGLTSSLSMLDVGHLRFLRLEFALGEVLHQFRGLLCRRMFR